MHAANLGDRREKVVYPSWMSDPKRVLLRRINRLDFGKELTEGLPDGISVRRESTKAQGGKDVLAVYVDGVKAHHESNLKEGAAERVAAWIEAYEKEENEVMALTGKALEILKTVAAAGVEGIAREKLIAQVKPGNSLTFMLKRHSALVGVDDTDHIFITEAGRTELRGLPEFDMPLDAGDVVSVEMPFVAGTCEESMTEDQLWAMTQEARAAMDAYDAATIHQLRRDLPAFAVMQMDELRSQFEAAAADGKAVKLVLGEGVGLGDVVQRDGAEMMAMGGVVIHLEIKLPLLIELYPPLRSLLDGFEAIGATVSVYGDLNITVERAECEDE